jgi:hypothetical protein
MEEVQMTQINCYIRILNELSVTLKGNVPVHHSIIFFHLLFT